MYIYRLSHGYEEENIEESRSSIQPFFRKGWMFRNIKDQRKFLSEVFDQWKISRDFDEFLVLLAQIWTRFGSRYITFRFSGFTEFPDHTGIFYKSRRFRRTSKIIFASINRTIFFISFSVFASSRL